MKTNDIITIKGVNKWYGDFHALNDINLTVKEGEIIVICGPSGSGKSTLIRCVNFLEKFQQGSIVVNNTELKDDVKKIRQVRSEVSMVFQHFNLFPHLSIIDNLTLAPIWVHNKNKQEAKEKALQLLDRVGIRDQDVDRGIRESVRTETLTEV
jgi:general L-amino acid transport system ATP-binding protein